ncbi:MAG: deoxyguanosinetriphosphate triphosphohydrolase [Erysipelotrichaceae bacterium]|nr:deoxyguanosinetriphosphate triphosphohydrolase [Erysipelotrichaceae bacterium]MCI9524562.1 deoxyguanosinetriphosphate triphosphohydrolase [Erysipelotrichaceae bacterium]
MHTLKWKNITNENRIPYQIKMNDYRNYRSEIESDYLRIISSASFRRLQDKTQVFPLDQSDFVRTRLTHSMEVSSIAKVIGKQICRSIHTQKLEREDALPDTLKVVETLNCAGLLHDLGNPPFGHFGETAIRNWFKQHLDTKTWKQKPLSAYLNEAQKLDFLYYEGNAQALRIITRLHRHVGDNGMHLTACVLDSIIKYPTDSLTKRKEDEKEKKQRSLLKKKIGYFQSERELFMEIKHHTGCENCRNPLAFILEAADDLAYTFADLEDGYNKGLYCMEDLLEIIHQAEDENGETYLKKAYENACAIKGNKEKGFDPKKQAVFHWLSSKQLYCISKVAQAFIDHYDAIMQGRFEQELIAVSEEARLIQSLKRFAFTRIYTIAPILKLELMGNEILTFLLDRFMDALIVYDSEEQMSDIQKKYIDLLSRNYLDAYHRAAMNKEEEEKLYDRLLLGCDFISGMTDSYAKRLYQELKGI